ncbi:MAG: NADH dehydrogenase FAD-containing subunit [Deltaproteobacteria bacterium]|nr:MAG: NADH dehydrogenase FAD-containing subunit [Deltaproteobacteria bacterium]RLB38835.1 MAG: NADH dehydrogenase FAD-containing subunit [Deltaproteobacteria bacterium]HDG98866.1 NADH dehydrogenase FAD-containing subunit [Desulfobacterales bacterium]
MNAKDLEKRVKQLSAKIQDLERRLPQDKLTIAVLSSDLDRVLSAFVIATAAAAMGMKVVMYFTFWAVAVLRDKDKIYDKPQSVIPGARRALGEKLPKGASEIKLPEPNPARINTHDLKALMSEKNIPSLEEMISMAEELGIQIYVAAKALEMLGFKPEEFIGLSFAGVVTFIQEAQSSKVQLII